jgi:hypothetical protein
LVDHELSCFFGWQLDVEGSAIDGSLLHSTTFEHEISG